MLLQKLLIRLVAAAVGQRLNQADIFLKIRPLRFGFQLL